MTGPPPFKLQEGERGKATMWWWKMIERANRYGAKTGERETAGRSKVPYAVLTVHTRVTPSFPGWVAVLFFPVAICLEEWSLAAFIQYRWLWEGALLCSISVVDPKLASTPSRIVSKSGSKLFGLLSRNWKTAVYLFFQKQWVVCLRMAGIEGSGLV